MWCKGGKILVLFWTVTTKEVQSQRIRLATWYRGTLLGKEIELINITIRRKSIIGLQETKWVGRQSRDIDNVGFKIRYSRKVKHRNSMRIVVDKGVKNNVVEVKRFGDKIIVLRMVLKEEILNIMSLYLLSWIR